MCLILIQSHEHTLVLKPCLSETSVPCKRAQLSMNNEIPWSFLLNNPEMLKQKLLGY